VAAATACDSSPGTGGNHRVPVLPTCPAPGKPLTVGFSHLGPAAAITFYLLVNQIITTRTPV